MLWLFVLWLSVLEVNLLEVPRARCVRKTSINYHMRDVSSNFPLLHNCWEIQRCKITVSPSDSFDSVSSNKVRRIFVPRDIFGFVSPNKYDTDVPWLIVYLRGNRSGVGRTRTVSFAWTDLVVFGFWKWERVRHYPFRSELFRRSWKFCEINSNVTGHALNDTINDIFIFQ